ELLSVAFENRPEWKQYLLNEQMAEENLRVAQTAYLPTVMLTGLTGNHVTEYPAYRSDVNSWAVTGSASWTLFDGLGIQKRIREAAANLSAQKAAEKQIRGGIELEVREAYLSLKSVKETIESVRKARESAEENYKVSNLRYRSGVGTNIEVIDAQVALTQAEINYNQALFDLEIAKAKIVKVAGKEVL
ncbi:TolC family protein, partial [Candidatus Saganbacteria bacterium]|nr:TolC family protein [Candidatus Saganbacteria bacterium]